MSNIDILKNRYGATVAKIACLYASRRQTQSFENFSEESHTVISPRQWDEKDHLWGFALPMGMPIYERGLSRKGYRKRFEQEVLSYWDGKLFLKRYHIISAEASQSKDEKIKSFIEWRDSENQEALAFIFLGIFWRYTSPEETLLEAAERFWKENQEFKEVFYPKGDSWLPDKQLPAKALWDNGALLFPSKKQQILGKRNCVNDPTSMMWAVIATSGYFSWIHELIFSDAYDDS